ncbi:MAG TPA: 50S ribosomal protein L24 [Patescibacteria group bacterium]|nr:50S ribosomal protein L24 [Patescibacteria group bacterium]
MKLRKGDSVKVVSGKDKGKVGKIEKIYPKENKILVEGVNQYKRHLKSRAQNQKSEIVTLTKPLPVAAVSLICPKCNKTTRVGFRVEKGKKEMFCKKCEKAI